MFNRERRDEIVTSLLNFYWKLFFEELNCFRLKTTDLDFDMKYFYIFIFILHRCIPSYFS